MSTECIFCRIIDGSLSASIVYEDEQAIAFMDIMPINPGHIKAHFGQRQAQRVHLDQWAELVKLHMVL